MLKLQDATVAHADTFGITLSSDSIDPVIILQSKATESTVVYEVQDDGSFSFLSAEENEDVWPIKITSESALVQLIPRLSQNF